MGTFMIWHISGVTSVCVQLSWAPHRAGLAQEHAGLRPSDQLASAWLAAEAGRAGVPAWAPRQRAGACSASSLAGRQQQETRVRL